MMNLNVLSASSKDSILLWDSKSLSTLHTFKTSASDANCLSPLFSQEGSCRSLLYCDYIVAAQHDKPQIAFFTWGKETPLLKSPSPERLTALCISPDGLYAVGGGVSGRLYIWQTSSGELLNIWNGHYKTVTCIKFTDDGSIFVSAGEDAIANVWSIIDALDISESDSLKPFHIFSGHSLPLTSLVISSGGRASRVITASMDRKVLVWDMPSGRLLQTIICPTFITAVDIDLVESRLFMGGGDGKVYLINLLLSAVNASSHAIAVVKASNITHSNDDSKELSFFSGNDKTVTSLKVHFDGKTLITGYEDGIIRLFDVESKKLLKTFTGHSSAVTAIFLIPCPPLLKDKDNSLAPLAPIAPFKKFQTKTKEEGVSSSIVVLQKDSISDKKDRLKRSSNHFNEDVPKKTVNVNNKKEEDNSSQIELLQNKVKELTESNARWESLNEKLMSMHKEPPHKKKK